jgi:hypothetical protein
LWAAATPAGANAFAAVDAPQTGNGELVLFVRDLNAPTRIYARGLGINMDNVLTTAEAAGAGYGGQGTTFDRNLPNVAADATLTSFLAGGSSFVWTIMAGDSTTSADVQRGERRYLTTLDPNLLAPPFDLQNAQFTSGFANLDGLFQLVNTQSFSATDSTAPNGAWSVGGPDTWWGANLYNENALPTSGTSAATLFVLANSSDSGLGEGLVWQLSTNVTMDAQGNLSFGGSDVPQVPVPAAVWLLGSALAGLATVRRRRAEADAVTA